MTYTVSELFAAARHAGFTQTQAVIAVAISLAEDTSRNPYATHVNTDGTADHGAWQINDVNADVIRANGDVNNLQDNARMAYAVYRRQGWSAWTTYKSGAYKSHLKEAATVSKDKSTLQKILDWPFPGSPVDGMIPGTKNSSGDTPIQNIGNLAGHLSDSGLWKRLGIGALGVFIIIIGITFMVESNKTVRGITEMAAA